MSNRLSRLVLAALVGAAAVAPIVPALAADDAVKATQWNIVRHLGVVPKFFAFFPESSLPRVWEEFKSLELNSRTALDPKTKELIALAVASQIDCSPCLYFHSAAATANGASGAEIREAVGMALITSSWSEVFTKDRWDVVKKDTDTLLSIGKLTFETPVTN